MKGGNMWVIIAFLVGWIVCDVFVYSILFVRLIRYINKRVDAMTKRLGKDGITLETSTAPIEIKCNVQYEPPTKAQRRK